MRLARLLQGVVDFCYPSVCAACETFVDGSAILCPTCAAQMDTLVQAPACPQCAMPSSIDGSPCAYCRGAGVAHFERVLRLCVFEDPIKHLIHQMKYQHRWPLGEYLADQLLATERAKGLLTEMEALVPVPLHFKRHVERGYNQAEVIAHRIGRKCKIPVVHAVRRTRDTEKQTLLHAHDRRIANVRGAFALRKAAKRIEGKHVAVIDDVMTTGATLNAVAQVLKQAEPATLCAIVIAIADPMHRGFEAK